MGARERMRKIKDRDSRMEWRIWVPTLSADPIEGTRFLAPTRSTRQKA